MSEPEPRSPAPGSLALIQRFINSTEMPDGVDELRTAPLAATWLRDATGADLTVSDRDLERLIATREALRDLLEGHTGENVDPAVAVRLEKLLGHAPLRPILSIHGATLVGDCRWIDSCRCAFYDHSKNGRSCWCSMRVCGSREKARTYRARQRAGATAQAQ